MDVPKPLRRPQLLQPKPPARAQPSLHALEEFRLAKEFRSATAATLAEAEPGDGPPGLPSTAPTNLPHRVTGLLHDDPIVHPLGENLKRYRIMMDRPPPGVSSPGNRPVPKVPTPLPIGPIRSDTPPLPAGIVGHCADIGD